MGAPKLTVEVVVEMRRAAKRGVTAAECARLAGVGKPAAAMAINGDRWANVNEIEPPATNGRFRQGRSSALLDEWDVRLMRAMRQNGATYKRLSEVFGVSLQAANRICRRISYGWVD